MQKLPRIILTEAVDKKLKTISTQNGYYCDFDEVFADVDIPTEYGKNGLYWSDGKARGKFGSNQKTELSIEVNGVLVGTADRSASVWGTLALADLERAFKSLGVKNIVSVSFDSDKWIETKGRTVARIYFAARVHYHNAN